MVAEKKIQKSQDWLLLHFQKHVSSFWNNHYKRRQPWQKEKTKTKTISESSPKNVKKEPFTFQISKFKCTCNNISRSSRSHMFCKMDALSSLAKFTELLRWSHFLMKRYSNTGVFLWILWIFFSTPVLFGESLDNCFCTYICQSA